MSRAENNNLGLEHGKRGDRIAVVIGGKQYYKGLYKPANPRTPKQQMHRAKIACINRLSKELADAVNEGFAMVPERGSGQTPRNAFVKANWDNGSMTWDEEKGEWGVRFEKLKVASGPRYGCRKIGAEMSEEGLRVMCTDAGMSDSHAVGDDRLMVAVYFPAAHTTALYEGLLRKECGETGLLLPEAGGGEEEMHVYAWFQATRYHRAGGSKTAVSPNQASESIYLGRFGKKS